MRFLIVSFMARARGLWRNLVRRRDLEAALDEELRTYIDGVAAENERRGLSVAEARRAALAEAGGLEQVKEATRDAWSGAALVYAAREIRFAIRSLLRSPSYAVVSVLTLGIGIGAATAVFTVVHGTLLRPLPAVVAPDRLVDVEIRLASGTLNEMSYPDFIDLRDNVQALSGLAVYNSTSLPVSGAGRPTRATINYVSGDFFKVLGVRPALGRLLGNADAVPHVPTPVVVVSYAFWQGRLGGVQDVIGRTLTIGGIPLTIVGVAPRGFIGAMSLYPMDLWIPLTMLQPIAHTNDPTARRGDGWFRAVGRLAPGRTVEQAQHEMEVVMAKLGATYTEDRGRGIRVFAGAGFASGERTDLAHLPTLLGIGSALLLLIACANVSTLTLIRSAARRRELATRLALGASRWMLASRLAIEGTLVAAGAALLGIGLARALVGLPGLVQSVVPMPHPDLALDAHVLLVTLAAAALTAGLVATIPALQIRGVSVGAVLKDGASGAVRRRPRAQRALVAGQLAASLVLLGASAAVFDAVHRILATDPGFDVRGVTYTLLDVQESGLDGMRQRAFYAALLGRASAQADIAGAALTSTIPPREWSLRAAVFRAEDAPTDEDIAGHDLDFPVRAYIDLVSPSLFDVLRIPLVRGRTFTDADNDHAPRVVIVSRRLAEALWPGRDPIGKLLAWPNLDDPPRPALRVVGVAADTRHASIADAQPPYVMYLPYTQEAVGNMFMLLRTRTGATLSPSEVRSLVEAVQPGVAVPTALPVAHLIALTVTPQRRASAWIGAFGLVALLLAVVGLYGVVAQSVLQRTRELAVRMALGASPRCTVRLLVREGLRLTAIGSLVGVAGCAIAVRVLGAELEGIGGIDVSAIAAANVALIATAFVASMIPARRAGRLDPVRVLRVE